MSSALEFLTDSVLRYGGWAVIEAVSDNRLRVRPSGDDDTSLDVLPPACLPCMSHTPGDSVFVLVPAEGPGVVVPSLTLQSAHTLQSAQPAAPALSVRNAGSIIRVEDRDGGLLFEHDEANGRTVVGVPVGDLEVRVPAGQFRVTASAVSIQSRGIDLAAERATIGFGLLDVVATRIRSRVKIYRAIVEELSELRVGKLRLFARLGMLLKAERGRLEADQDLVVRGRTVRIN